MSEHKFSVIPGRALRDTRITDSVYRTLSALCMYADKDGWCWPSQGTLAEDIGKTRKTVNSHLQFLEEIGYITSEYRSNPDGSPTSKRYQVIYDQITQTPSTLDYSDPEYSGLLTNDSMNDSNNMASGEFSPSSELPLEWQIASGKEITKIPDNNDAKFRDSANIIAMSFGADQLLAYGIAYTFMRERNIVIPQSKLKGQRKAVKEMIEMGVNPQHVMIATKELLAKNMTLIDLYSVSKTAIDIANPSVDSSLPQSHDKFEGV